MGHKVRIGAAVAAIAVTGGAVSAEAKIRALPSQDSQFRKGSNTLAKAMAQSPARIKRGTFSIIPPGGRPAAISDTRLAGFPRHGKTYVILSTGDSRYAARKNSSGAFGRGAGGPFVRGARDVLIFRVDVRVPKGVTCLSYSFRFLSEEFPEFVDSDFNDAFISELNGSTWTSRSNEDPTIEAPRNFAKDPNGRNISVNQAGAFTVNASNAKGTTYDGATDLLRASTRVTPGIETVYFSIFDQGDRQYDSAVFLDNLRLDDKEECATGVVIDG